MTTAYKVLLLATAAAALGSPAGPILAQTPYQRDTTIPGAASVPGAPQASNPQREKVERADAAAKALEDSEITDPTVLVKSAALGALTAIELAKIAQAKSQDASIQSFAGRVLEDNDALYRDLASIAKRKRLDVPTSLVYEDEQTLAKAAEKSGPEFSSWYAQQMIAESQKAIALFHGAVKMQDAELAAFARKTMPVLEEHQRMAMALGRPVPP